MKMVFRNLWNSNKNIFFKWKISFENNEPSIFTVKLLIVKRSKKIVWQFWRTLIWWVLYGRSPVIIISRKGFNNYYFCFWFLTQKFCSEILYIFRIQLENLAEIFKVFKMKFLLSKWGSIGPIYHFSEFFSKIKTRKNASSSEGSRDRDWILGTLKIFACFCQILKNSVNSLVPVSC